MLYMLKIGDNAPLFSLPNDAGTTTDLAALKGKSVVIYFYPKDDTPGCTVEANEFTSLIKKFEAKNTVVLGVSKDSVASHCKFRDKFDLKVQLVSDEEGKMVEAYGVWVEKSMYGKKYMGIQRDTFLIDENGKIKAIWQKVKAEGHAEEVLAAL
jgi:thioredoxin-dependent peroxiredoxin